MFRRWLLKQVLHIVLKHEILDNIHEDKQKKFQAEAQLIRSTEFWDWLIQDMYLKTEREMFNHSKTNEGWWFSKGMLYALDMIREKVVEFENKRVPMNDSKEKKSMFKLR